MSEDAPHQLVVDSIEEGIAAVEVDGRSFARIPVWLLPLQVREGDVFRMLIKRDGTRSTVTIEPDPERQKELLARSKAQTTAQVGRDEGGNIRL
jgi:hypothetical protein